MILAIDPGDEHCGMATFVEDESDWEIAASWEETPDGCIDMVIRCLQERSLEVLVVEEFRLYPWSAQAQAFSQMKTAELIGALRLVHRLWGKGCEWEEQGASIKKPTRKILKALGIGRLPGTSDHAADAQLHGWHYILKREDAA